MTTTSSPTKPRKTLKQSLKTLLRFRPGQSAHNDAATIGSGILRRAEPSYGYQLPQFSGLSLFPDFGASNFDVGRYAARNQAQRHLPTSIQQPRTKHSLLPATSLSQFDLHQTFAQHGEVKLHSVVYEAVPDSHLLGISRQASLASLSPSTLHKSPSTLRIRESKRDLRCSPTLTRPSNQQAKVHSRSHTRQAQADLHRDLKSARQSSQVDSSSPARTPAYSTSSERRDQSPLPLVEHFKSFCVLDTAVSGCPITGTSTELRFIFDIGEAFFLNNQEVEGTSMDIITGFDTAGNPVTHLVLFSPLISPSSGRSRFMLAALVDITAFLEETAALPELDTISEESSVASLAEVMGTPSAHASPGWKTVSHELSVEDLLGGCSLSDEPPLKSGGLAHDDIWLDLALSEKQGREAARYNSRSRQRRYLPPTPSSIGTHSTASSVDDVDAFVSSLQTLYSDFFILGKNALDDNCYEICNISPSVYDTKEYVDGHLSRTPQETLDSLSNNLTKDEPFTLNVHWGNAGAPKTLYCSPMYGQRSVTWICFLVDAQMPLLW